MSNRGGMEWIDRYANNFGKISIFKNFTGEQLHPSNVENTMRAEIQEKWGRDAEKKAYNM